MKKIKLILMLLLIMSAVVFSQSYETVERSLKYGRLSQGEKTFTLSNQSEALFLVSTSSKDVTFSAKLYFESDATLPLHSTLLYGSEMVTTNAEAQKVNVYNLDYAKSDYFGTKITYSPGYTTNTNRGYSKNSFSITPMSTVFAYPIKLQKYADYLISISNTTTTNIKISAVFLFYE